MALFGGFAALVAAALFLVSGMSVLAALALLVAAAMIAAESANHPAASDRRGSSWRVIGLVVLGTVLSVGPALLLDDGPRFAELPRAASTDLASHARVAAALYRDSFVALAGAAVVFLVALVGVSRTGARRVGLPASDRVVSSLVLLVLAVASVAGSASAWNGEQAQDRGEAVGVILLLVVAAELAVARSLGGGPRRR